MGLKLDEANQTVDDLKQKNEEASDVIKRLKTQILAFEADKWKADQTIKEMKIKQVEANQNVDDHKVKLLEALERVEGFNNLLTFDNLKGNSTKEAKDVNAPVFKRVKQHVNNDGLLAPGNVDFGVLADVMPAAHLTSSSPYYVYRSGTQTAGSYSCFVSF